MAPFSLPPATLVPACVCFSAAIRASAEEGEIANGREFFVEARKCPRIFEDSPKEVAGAMVSAAAEAAATNSKPKRPDRVNHGLEAVYTAVLKVNDAWRTNGENMQENSSQEMYIRRVIVFL